MNENANNAIPNLTGRVKDPSTAKKAKRRAGWYKFQTIAVLVPMIPLLFVLIYGRLTGGVNPYLERVISMIICGALTLNCFFGTRWQVYTGRCGCELKDKDGSPFIGKLVFKNGIIKPINIIWLAVIFAIITGACLRYLSVVPVKSITSVSGLWNKIKTAFSNTSFLFSVVVGAGCFSAVMVYGLAFFWKKLAGYSKGYLPAFFTVQLIVSLISALLFLVMYKLSEGSEASSVVDSLGKRILTMSYDIGSPTALLLGGGSVLSSISTASFYVTMYDYLIEHINDDHQLSYRENIMEMIKDRNMLRSFAVIIVSLIYTCISKVTPLSGFLGLAVKVIIIAVWIAGIFKTIITIKVIRYFHSVTAVVLLDVLFVLPEVTDVWSGLLVIPAFLLRSALFVVLGIMLALYFKLMSDTADLSKLTRGEDITHEQSLQEMFLEENNGQSFTESVINNIMDALNEDE